MMRGRIAELSRGDLVEVTWLDACSFRNVRVFTKEVYMTVKKTVGLFHSFLDDHLILISLDCILRVEKLGPQRKHGA